MTILMILLAVLAGAVLSVQAAINGALGARVGVLRCTFLTFALGALLTALLIFFFEPHYQLSLLEVPKWQLIGALLGVPYIVIMVLAVQRIGSAIATVAVIFGQLTMSMLIDHFGWLGIALCRCRSHDLGLFSVLLSLCILSIAVVRVSSGGLTPAKSSDMAASLRSATSSDEVALL